MSLIKVFKNNLFENINTHQQLIDLFPEINLAIEIILRAKQLNIAAEIIDNFSEINNFLADTHNTILICGSLYLAGHFLALN